MIRLFGTGREEITAACLGYPAHNDLAGYAQDYANDVGVDSKIPKISPIYGTTYLVEALRIKQPTSIIGLNTLT